MEFGKVMNHQIIIEASGNKGFIVTVGCGRFAFEKREKLLEALDDYLTHPKEFEKVYNETCGGDTPGDAPDDYLTTVTEYGC